MTDPKSGPRPDPKADPKSDPKPDPKAERRLARSAARLAAVQALFQMEATGGDMRAVRKEFETYRIGQVVEDVEYREANLELFRALLNGAVTRQAEIDQLTHRALVERWPLGRIDPTLRALFRAAGSELVTEPNTPPKVIITEYVDIAKAFFPEGKEGSFVNAVLDHMAREARPEAFSR